MYELISKARKMQALLFMSPILFYVIHLSLQYGNNHGNGKDIHPLKHSILLSLFETVNFTNIIKSRELATFSSVC